MSVVAPARAHHGPKRLSDRFALRFTRLLRWPADTFFARRYGHRASVLETVAAVPGMVGATLKHVQCLRGIAGSPATRSIATAQGNPLRATPCVSSPAYTALHHGGTGTSHRLKLLSIHSGPSWGRRPSPGQ